jgi:hypothetical protein
MEVGNNHGRGPVHSRGAMNVNPVTVLEKTVKRGNACGQSELKIDRIEISYGRIEKR